MNLGSNAFVPVSKIVFRRIGTFEGLPEFKSGRGCENLACRMRERHLAIPLPVMMRNLIYTRGIGVRCWSSIGESPLLGRKRRDEGCGNCDERDGRNRDVASSLLRDQPRGHDNQESNREHEKLRQIAQTKRHAEPQEGPPFRTSGRDHH